MKKRIIGATLFTVVCALLISNVVGVLMFRSREMDAARNTLQELLTLMDAQSAITEPEELLRQFSQAAPDKRLTIIDTDGTVLADSEADVSAMEAHEDRPEVMEAEATGWGEAVRQSDTVGTSMLYVAKRFADNMVGRAAMPVSSINSLALGSVGGFTLAAVAALILTLLLASRTANRAAAPLDAVGTALQGVLDGKEPPAGLNPDRAYDELRPLLRTIDKLVERLRGYIQSITAERDKVGLILDCMAEGLILLDDEGNVLAINRAARNLFGFPEGEEVDGALLFTRSRRLREAIQQSRDTRTAVVLDVDALTDDARSLRLFLSPVVDMEALIRRMMGWAGVTEERLAREGSIPTTFGQTLSWEYLRYVRTHPVRRWRTPTAILYGARDHLTDRATVEAFATRNGCRLTVEEAGEHWFHTPQQLAAVDRWQRACLADLG